MWNLVFLFSGFFLISLLLLVFKSKKTNPFVENRIFIWLTITNFVGFITEILAQISIRTLGKDDPLVIVLGKFYLVYILVWMGIFSIYVFLVTRKVKENEPTEQGIPVDKTKPYKRMRIIHIIYILITSIIVYFLPILIFYENDSMYSHGTAVEFLRIVLVIYVILWIVRLALNRKLMRHKKILPIFTIIVLLAANVILQAFNPTILIATFIMMYTCYVLYFTIENPDLKIIAQLNRANIKAESSNKIKDEFIRQLGHETNTVMNLFETSMSSVKEIVETKKDDELTEWTNYAYSSAVSLADMIRNSLASARFKAGDIILQNKLYTTKELSKEIEILPNRFKNDKEHIKFNFKIINKLPLMLIGDKAAIKEIFYNLISNAYKYTEDGYINITVESEIKEDICVIKIVVEDTGIGIKKSEMKNLFNRFERIDFEHNQSDKRGIGLGLINTKEIVNLMDGNIRVESIYGKGSIFTIIIKQKMVNSK
ncbi:MAG: sensor histidine kinase [Bacilli bacterium]